MAKINIGFSQMLRLWCYSIYYKPRRQQQERERERENINWCLRWWIACHQIVFIFAHFWAPWHEICNLITLCIFVVWTLWLPKHQTNYDCIHGYVKENVAKSFFYSARFCSFSRCAHTIYRKSPDPDKKKSWRLIFGSFEVKRKLQKHGIKGLDIWRMINQSWFSWGILYH